MPESLKSTRSPQNASSKESRLGLLDFPKSLSDFMDESNTHKLVVHYSGAGYTEGATPTLAAAEMNAAPLGSQEVGVVSDADKDREELVRFIKSEATADQVAELVRISARMRSPVIDLLMHLSLEEREIELKKRYSKRVSWTEAKSNKPTPEEFLAWLDRSFPDRRQIGMVLSDLKYLDKAAYDKVMNWSRSESGIPAAMIESFGLPSKITRYDPARDANAPASLSEAVSRAQRGDGSFKELNRQFARARYHAPK